MVKPTDSGRCSVRGGALMLPMPSSSTSAATEYTIEKHLPRNDGGRAGGSVAWYRKLKTSPGHRRTSEHTFVGPLSNIWMIEPLCSSLPKIFSRSGDAGWLATLPRMLPYFGLMRTQPTRHTLQHKILTDLSLCGESACPASGHCICTCLREWERTVLRWCV